jgi:hypothetical protein
METIQGEKKAKPKTKSNVTVLRVLHDTRKKIMGEVAKANKKELGRKIRSDDILALAISLIEPQHIKKLQEASLSNADRLEREYRAYIVKNGPISKDAYLGKRLTGEVSNLGPDAFSHSEA